MTKLRVNDKVIWRGNWGSGPPKVATVEGIEINTRGSKEGDPVNEVEWSQVTRENCIVSLDNGHWAYGNQISRRN
jgi:hypothetical protein